METERYNNKKFPTNEDMFNFFGKYGIICIVIITILLIVFIQIGSIITRSIECGNVEWKIDPSNNDHVVSYNNNVYRIGNINNYESLDKIVIELIK